MKKTLASLGVTFAAILFSGSVPSSPFNALLERELQSLTDRGLCVQLIGEVVEATDPVSGQTWRSSTEMLTLRLPTYPGLPTLTLDLTTIDTNLYNWKFHYVNSLPLSGEWGFPLQVGDLNHNGKPESYGLYQTQAIYVARVYEQDTTSQWIYKNQYPENTGLVDKQADIDGNGLSEVYLRYGDSLFAFEQASPSNLPLTIKFRHRQWYQSATGIPNQVYDMSGDGHLEVLYPGSRLDSAGQPNVRKTFIMRFDQGTNNLEEVWSKQLPLGCQSQECTGAIAAGDFYEDGNAELVTSNFAGNLYLVEKVLGDSFAVAWSSNLSVAGRAAAGDVDGNGTVEFFVGGTQMESDGYVHLRAYAFERTSDNIYQPVFAFNIFPTGIFFVDLYQTADIDGDGIPELLISTAGGILIVKGAGEHNYELFYYQAPFALDGVAAWRINNNSSASLFVSRHLGGQPVVKRTDVYQLDSSLVVGVREERELPASVHLLQNYPNPFNNQTIITYELPRRGRVKLQIFDILGKEVVRLVDEIQSAGRYAEEWKAVSNSSGVYLLKLTFDQHVETRKMLYIK